MIERSGGEKRQSCRVFRLSERYLPLAHIFRGNGGLMGGKYKLSSMKFSCGKLSAYFHSIYYSGCRQ